jgi:DNA topoisomerase-1
MNATQEAATEARAAGLRYVTDELPGIHRRGSGRAFRYTEASGAAIRDKHALARIRALAIPPAYVDVWICPLDNGHIQATGRDARGRKQYRYHAKWRAARDETKYERTLAFAAVLPSMRKRITSDLRKPGVSREKVLAAIVRLLEATSIRVGNDEYAKDNGSYGLTTMQNRHASVSGNTITFTFRGKSGIKHAIALNAPPLAKIVRACQDIPGQDLFSYIDDTGAPHGIDSADVNDYIRAVSGDDFSAKDFRTWIGTVSFVQIIASQPAPETEAERKQRIVEAIKVIARRLGNTPAICRKCYVHPDIVEAYSRTGKLGVRAGGKIVRGLDSAERFVATFLKRRAKKTATAPRAS